MSRWFRMYDELLDDPKVQRLSGDEFKAWVNLLCLASRNEGVLPSMDDIAFALRLDAKKARALIDRLVSATLLDVDGDHFAPHGWNARQYKSDVSTDRVKRFRERSKRADETAPETDTETDNTTDKSVVPAQRANRLPADFVVPSDWLTWSVADRGWSRSDAEAEAATFVDYWHAKSGRDATKLDWQATWRNWCRNSRRATHSALQPVVPL